MDERGARPYRGLNSLDELINVVSGIRQTEELAMRQHFASFQPIELEEDEVKEVVLQPDVGAEAVVHKDNSDPKNVFLVHGRNENAKEAMVKFLQAIGLKPLDIERDLVPLTRSASPSILDVIIEGFKVAKAVVVLLTPDEESRLREPFANAAADRALVLQARPNVYFEAGYAFHSHPARTVLIEVGHTQRLSDISNLLAVPMNNSELARDAVIQRLTIAGCVVDIQNDDWKTAGDFEAAVFD